LSSGSLAGRIRAFTQDMERAMADETIEWEHGVAHFNSRYPVKYALNYLRLSDPPDTLKAPALIAHAERIMAERNLGHRRVNGWGPDGGPFYEEMGDAGWNRDRLVVMAHDSELRPRPVVEVEAVPFEVLKPSMIAFDTSQDANPNEVATQLAESRSVLLEAADVTFLVARIEDQIAGWCELYVRDGIAQVENVMTFPDFRNRGIASSVVNEALRRGYAAGAEVGFLFADGDDWPKALYEKLGFTTIDHFWEYTQPHDA
jgi:GNAT superfamily N-acetyltransferase